MAPSGKITKHHKASKAATDYVHPSLQSSSKGSPAEKTQSVSERIEFLRRVQTPRQSAQDKEDQASSAAPLVSGPSQCRPQPRVAGPRPPKSWTDRPNAYQLAKVGNYSFARRIPRLDYFPGVEFPPVNSLLHQSLKSLAVGFEWHAEYDGAYLASLPVRIKDLLFSYIARYGPEEGISADDDLLQVLYSQEELEQFLPGFDDEETAFVASLRASGCDDLTRLDLGGSMGRKMRFKQLERCWRIGTDPRSYTTPDTWEEAAAEGRGHQLSISPPMRPRFPSLTRLSLANPGRGASWPDLLHFSRHLTSLTHLSLARWPTPCFSTATAQSFIRDPTRINNPAPAQTPDLETCDSAVEALRMLSRNTPSLVYLSLAGCETWFSVLTHAPAPANNPTTHHGYSSLRLARAHADQDRFFTDPDSAAQPGAPIAKRRRCAAPASIPWTTTWRHLATLDLSQSHLPTHVRASTLFELHTASKASASRMGQFAEVEGPSGCYYDPACGDAVHVAMHVACKYARDWRSGLSQLRLQLRGQGEELGVASADGGVMEMVRNRKKRKVWLEREIQAVDVAVFMRFVGELSAGGARRHVEVLHGWGKRELLEAGYDEQELFEAGF